MIVSRAQSHTLICHDSLSACSITPSIVDLVIFFGIKRPVRPLREFDSCLIKSLETMQASQSLKKSLTHDANREIKDERTSLNGIKFRNLKWVLDGETAKKEKGVAPARIQFFDCQSAQRESSEWT